MAWAFITKLTYSPVKCSNVFARLCFPVNISSEISNQLHFSELSFTQNVRRKMAQLNFKWLFCDLLEHKITIMTNRLISCRCVGVVAPLYSSHDASKRFKNIPKNRTQDSHFLLFAVGISNQRWLVSPEQFVTTHLVMQSENILMWNLLISRTLRNSKAQFPISIHAAAASDPFFFSLYGGNDFRNGKESVSSNSAKWLTMPLK